MNAQRVLAVCLAAVLAAAIVASASKKDDPDAKPPAHSKAKTPALLPRFQRCGTACPARYHVASQTCNAVACQGKCPNQVWCEKNGGKLFQQCGLTCPDGYHAKDQTCNVTACPGSCPNQAWCEKD